MNNWTSGYVADISYTYGYYYELNPQRVKLPFLNAGLRIPHFHAACELGFGQGLSANIHAASSSSTWYGTDFIPSQASFAQELAATSGAQTHFFDEAFDIFSKRDLPEFDYIGLHGIWSWVSDENRKIIVDFICKKLKVGGVLYISYNTLPGWGTFAPMRHLITKHAEVIGAGGAGIVSRIDGAIEFTEKLLATNPAFTNANPLVNEKINELKIQNRQYLAHEYFNRDWKPMHFDDMACWLEPAKLSYACSAHYLDHVDALNLTIEQQGFLKNIQDPIFKQTVRDFMVNQQFRRDYWVKGARKLTQLEQIEHLRSQRFILSAYRPDVSLKVSGSLGEAILNEAIYIPILNLMTDFKIRTLAQIEYELKDSNISFAQLSQALLLLCNTGALAAAQEDAVISKAKTHTDKLNTFLLMKARSSNDISYMASPVTGGGVNVGRFEQLFLLSMQQGKKEPGAWASDVEKILKMQGQKIVKEGKTLETSEETLFELNEQARIFSEKKLPILLALQII